MPLRVIDLVPGSSAETVLTPDLTRTQIVQYAGASGDYHPLHTDEVFATKVAGYPSVFAHGMLTMGMSARAVTDFAGDGRLVRYGGRFLAQVWPGDRLVTRLTVGSLRAEQGQMLADFTIVTLNGTGDAVFSGYATSLIDP